MFHAKYRHIIWKMLCFMAKIDMLFATFHVVMPKIDTLSATFHTPKNRYIISNYKFSGGSGEDSMGLAIVSCCLWKDVRWSVCQVKANHCIHSDNVLPTYSMAAEVWVKLDNLNICLYLQVFQRKQMSNMCVILWIYVQSVRLKYIVYYDLEIVGGELCFTANNSNHSYNTRHATQLRATITRTAYYYRCFTVSGLNMWNSLPNHIKECTSLSSFKWSLYNHMLTKPQF